MRINSVVQGIVPASDQYQATTSSSARDLCVRFCNLLGLKGQKFVKVSQGLADKITIGDLAGRSPLSVAAASIYMASWLLGDGKIPKQISQVIGVSDGTIKTSYKLLYQDREKMIEPEWIADLKGDMGRLPNP
jgi:transcription initiation factor TFIIB